ncbi:hypothetical protein ILUMI_08352 [Ignelater luminosus]|uniref:Uncharacterized protein n=1 Tax=Ignelater luminosus TaxID=2038154 RepID=A0A8K0GDH4_IGNLU|nr:hypothetical protein ILUMI_08352 [Ignelater luminosus]
MTVVLDLILVNDGAHVYVRKFEHCDINANYDILYNLTFKIIGNKQYVDGLMHFKVPLDNNLRSQVSVDILIGRRFTHLLNITENKSCTALHKYLGEFFYDLERNAQLIPGICPLSEGKHYLHNFYVDFNKATTLVNFPFGYLRFKGNMCDNKHKVLTCLVMELENRL